MLLPPHEGNLICGNPLVKGVIRALGSHPQVQVMRLQGGQQKFCRSPFQGGSPNLRTVDYMLRGGLSLTKRKFWAQDQETDPRKSDPTPSCHLTVDRRSDYHDVSLLLQDRVPEVQQPGNGQVWKDSGSEVFWCGVPIFSCILPHLGMPSIRPRTHTAWRAYRSTQMVTKGEYWIISWKVPMWRR